MHFQEETSIDATSKDNIATCKGRGSLVTEVVHLENLVTELSSASSSLCRIYDPKIRTGLVI